MKWQPATCSQCGANISVKPGQKCAVCPYCGTTLTASEAVAKFSATYMTNYVNADVIYLGNRDDDYEIVAGELIKYRGPETVVAIPSTVHKIGPSAFLGQDITKVVIPSGVETIGGSAFAHCKKLEEVELSRGLRSIGANAFADCEKLSSITLPDTVTAIHELAFIRTGITSVRLPAGVKVDNAAFANSNLTTLYLGEDLVSFTERTNIPGVNTNLTEIVATDGTHTSRSFTERACYRDTDDFYTVYDSLENSPIGKGIEKYAKEKFNLKKCLFCGAAIRTRYNRIAISRSRYYCEKCGTLFDEMSGLPERPIKPIDDCDD